MTSDLMSSREGRLEKLALRFCGITPAEAASLGFPVESEMPCSFAGAEPPAPVMRQLV